MRRARALVSKTAAAALTLAGALAVADGGAAPAAAQTLALSPVTQERARAVAADGSVVSGGLFGGQWGGCAAGAQGYVERRAADGTLLWQRFQLAADPDCNQHPGQPLFAGVAGVDAGHVVNSTVEDVAIDPATGDVLAAGEAHLAWQDGPGAPLETSRVAFVVRFTAAGAFAGGDLIGTLPASLPPAGAVGCAETCAAGEPARGEAFGGRGVAPGPGGTVVVAGWLLPDAPAAPGGRALFLARYDAALTTRLWLAELDGPGDDVGVDVVTDPQDTIFVTGYGGVDRDLLVARCRADGTFDRQLTGGGDHDDEGEGVSVDAAGRVVVAGFVTGQAIVDGVPVGVPGQGRQGLTARFDRDLRLLGHTLDAPPPPADGGLLTPVHYEVKTGSWGTGAVGDLAASDDAYLHLYEGDGGAQAGAIELLVTFAPAPVPFLLGPLSLELTSTGCYHATVGLRGALSEEILTVGEREVCPGDEPVLTADVPPEISIALGFDGVNPPGPGKVLVVVVEIAFAAQRQCMKCATAALDASVDEIDVGGY